MLLMTSSPIKNELVHNYVDNGPISIPTKFQSTTPNNKEVTVGADCKNTSNGKIKVFFYINDT